MLKLLTPEQLRVWESAVCCNWWPYSCNRNFKASKCLPEWRGDHSGHTVGRRSSQPGGCHWFRAPQSWHPSYHHQIKPPGRAEGCLQRQQTWKQEGKRHQIHTCWHPGSHDGNIQLWRQENSSKFKVWFLQWVQRARTNISERVKITKHHRKGKAVWRRLDTIWANTKITFSLEWLLLVAGYKKMRLPHSVRLVVLGQS